MSSKIVVVIGAGQAGLQVAGSLRDAGFDGGIVLVGQELFSPYQRPPLSKAFLCHSLAEEALALKPEAFYADRAIDLLVGERVTAVDPHTRRVILSKGRAITYDHLIFATGARNRQLEVDGANLDGVVSLRDIPDAIRLREQLEVATRLVVIGGGFIGLEVAASCEGRGVPVTIVEMTSRLMGRAVSPEISEFFAAAHRAAGAEVLLNASVRRLHGAGGRVVRVELCDGRSIETDVVLVGIGIIANDELAASAGLEINGGIVVNDRLLTRDQRISAIGDCTRYPSPYASSLVRVESVQNAVDQGRWVASRLTGGDGRFTAVPWFWSDQGAMKLRMAGLRHPEDQTLVWGNPEAGAFSVFSFRDGTLVACDCVNRPSDQMSVRQLLQLNIRVRRDLFDDPKFTLKELVPNLRERDGGSQRPDPTSLPT